MIDGITWYERPAKQKDFTVAIDAILAIVEGCENVVVNLLLSCHGCSRLISRSIDDEDMLLVPFEIDGNGQVWSDRAWDRNIGHEIEDLGDDASD